MPRKTTEAAATKTKKSVVRRASTKKTTEAAPAVLTWENIAERAYYISLEADSGRRSQTSAFVATLVAFFIAEIGDKTQIATLALAAAYSNLVPVVAGTTAGMLLANIPVIFLGKAFSDRLPLKTIHYFASGLFLILGAVFVFRAVHHTL